MEIKLTENDEIRSTAIDGGYLFYYPKIQESGNDLVLTWKPSSTNFVQWKVSSNLANNSLYLGCIQISKRAKEPSSVFT